MKRDTVERYVVALRQTPQDADLLRRVASDLGASMGTLIDLENFNKALPSLLLALNGAASTVDGPPRAAALMIAAIGFGFGRTTSLPLHLLKFRQCRSAEAQGLVSGVAIGEALAELDPEEARRVIHNAAMLDAAQRDISVRVVTSFSGRLREEATQTARSDPERLSKKTYPPLVVPIAVALLPEPLFPNQLSSLLGCTGTEVHRAVEDGRRLALFTSAQSELDELHLGPIPEGAIALTVKGRPEVRRILRRTVGDTATGRVVQKLAGFNDVAPDTFLQRTTHDA